MKAIRRVGASAAATAVLMSLMTVPAASAAPAPASVPASASVSASVSAATSAAKDRNPHVSRSMRGVLPSAYIGRKYVPAHDRARRCIVKRESGGNYRIVNRWSGAAGAYQFMPSTANAAARAAGMNHLVGKRANTWTRYEQDKAFWALWNKGKGKGHWRGGGYRCF